MTSADAVAWTPTRLVVLQPTTYCNLDCSYCYLPLTGSRQRMDVDTVAAIGRFLGHIDVKGTPLTVSWHSGEPLTVTPAFYQEAFEILRDTQGCPDLRHTFQTNATLVDDRWCELFTNWDVDVGVSLDGPEWIHDRRRVDRRGQGSFRRALRGVRKLFEHGLDPSVITVLSDFSLRHPDEVWDTLTSAGFRRIAFNVEELEAANAQADRHFSADVCAEYRDFLCRMSELRQSQPDVHIRELDDVDRFLRSRSTDAVRSIENLPGAVVSISASGEISTFSPELLDLEHERYGTFTWGNVHRDVPADVQRHRDFVTVATAIAAGVERCRRDCEYFPVCGGGAPSNKLGEHNTFVATETLDCRLRVQASTEAYLQILGV